MGGNDMVRLTVRIESLGWPSFDDRGVPQLKLRIDDPELRPNGGGDAYPTRFVWVNRLIPGAEASVVSNAIDGEFCKYCPVKARAVELGFRGDVATIDGGIISCASAAFLAELDELTSMKLSPNANILEQETQVSCAAVNNIGFMGEIIIDNGNAQLLGMQIKI